MSSVVAEIGKRCAAKAGQNSVRMLAGSSRRMGKGNAGRIIAAPWPVIAGQRPEVSGFGLFPPRSQNGRGRFIHEELGGTLQIGHQCMIG